MSYLGNTKKNALLVLKSVKLVGVSAGQIVKKTQLSRVDTIRLLAILIEYNILYVDEYLVKLAKHLRGKRIHWNKISELLNNIEQLT